MAKTEITNMVMVYDETTGLAVMQRRVKYWCGISFPGGHPEPGESLYDSAVREVKEETGLTVWDLTPCGAVHWAHENGDRYFVFLYKTCRYAGELLDETAEGAVFWADPESFPESECSPNFPTYLRQFLSDTPREVYYRWNDTERQPPRFL